MNPHLGEAVLNDYIDHALAGPARAEVDAHLTECAACRAELAALRAMIERVGALPLRVQPERDLLPDIHSALAAPLPFRRRWSQWLPLAAAALLLIAVTAIFTQQVASKKYQARLRAGAHVQLVGSDARALDAKYISAIEELEALLEAQQLELSPGTRALLRQNLQVIDQAIRESRAALQNDSANAVVNEMLRAAYEKKLDVLRRATTVIST